MNESAMLQQRRLARQEKALIDKRLIDLHIKAASALDDPDNPVRNRALQQITKWEKGHLCNERYILAWRTILNLPSQARHAAMLREDSEGIALRQNSPFGFIARE